ncbi:MAG: hypothetical protein ABFS35_19555 [Bacteroidota bacterium]
MEAYKFETKVLENGIIKIPEISKYKNQEIEIIVMFKPIAKKAKQKKSIEEFFDKWGGYFSAIETNDERYNAIMDKHK